MQRLNTNFQGTRAPAVRLLVLLAVLAAAVLSCAKKPPPPVPEKPDPAALEPEKEKPADVKNAPLAGNAFKLLAPGLLGDIADKPELKDLRARGILKVQAPCNRPGLCNMNDYDVAFGFEPQLMGRIARQGLGVKENIVKPGAGAADLRMAVPCGAPDAPPSMDDRSGAPPLAGPYFYSAKSGWLCIEVRRGGHNIAQALDLIIAHFYDSGTFQDLYKEWFPLNPESGGRDS